MRSSPHPPSPLLPHGEKGEPPQIPLPDAVRSPSPAQGEGFGVRAPAKNLHLQRRGRGIGSSAPKYKRQGQLWRRYKSPVKNRQSPANTSNVGHAVEAFQSRVSSQSSLAIARCRPPSSRIAVGNALVHRSLIRSRPVEGNQWCFPSAQSDLKYLFLEA
jgi:hypothetical protein